MENISLPVYAGFGLTLILTLYLFYRATQQSKGFIILLSIWLCIQSIVGIFGFYTVANATAPRFQWLLLPPLVFTIVQFSTKRGRLFIDSLNLEVLTIIHIVRIPVEILLYWLFVGKAVPEMMTFEGRNFDIISGFTAPFIDYLGFVKSYLNKYVMIAWNILCLGLLINVIIIGLLSAPTPFQQFSFQQPNIAVLHFPFLFLPACIVPLILFSHAASIRLLIINKSFTNKF